MVNIKKIETPEEYRDFINQEGKISVLKFYADWCGPCRMLTEKIKGMDESKITNVLIGEINADDEAMETIVSDCGIRSIPVLIYYKDGKEVERSTGLVSADIIYKTIEELS